MKKYFNELVQTTTDIREDLKKYDKKEAEINRWLSEDIITDEYYKQEMEKVQNEKSEVIESCMSKYDSIENDFKTAMSDKYSLKHEDITGDTKLLDGTFKLKQEDIDRLSEKYRDNFTMTLAIDSYTLGHDLKSNMDEVLSDRAETERGFENLKQYCKSAITDNILYENINEMRDKVYN